MCDKEACWQYCKVFSSLKWKVEPALQFISFSQNDATLTCSGRSFISKRNKHLNHFWQVAVLASCFSGYCNVFLIYSCLPERGYMGLFFRKVTKPVFFQVVFGLSFKLDVLHPSLKLSYTSLGTDYSGTSIPLSIVHYSQHGETLAKTSLCLCAVFSRKRTFKSYH